MPPSFPSTRPSPLDLFRAMVQVRAFELLLLELWEEGLISGELHLGTGEEAVAAGIAANLEDGDALALDHRPTPLMLLRGVDPVLMVREMLGHPDGLCGGVGGHMHLFSREHTAASSGIVGSSAPLGCGFALAAARLRPGSVAVATLGEGAMNQGMVMEALNLAAVWKLPLVVVSKDNGWAITTESRAVTGGDLAARAEAVGVPTRGVDGGDPAAVAQEARVLVRAARKGKGPGFLLARCPRLDGHMAGFLMDRLADEPLSEGRGILGRVASSSLAPGAGILEKMTSAGVLGRSLMRSRRDRRGVRSDPLRRARRLLPPDEAHAVEEEVAVEMSAVRAAAVIPSRAAG
jgi:TPP-dependent pyruvate/acetoin dehydrogenase alpha subunit